MNRTYLYVYVAKKKGQRPEPRFLATHRSVVSPKRSIRNYDEEVLGKSLGYWIVKRAYTDAYNNSEFFLK